MSFRSLRERKRLSQEKLAELSGLSLRTIQRLEAGHRVSYGSLRSLAATLDMDVDLLERELYAMKQSTDEFVEVPRWVRLLTDGQWMGAKPTSRQQAHLLEGYCIVGGILLLFGSIFVHSEIAAAVLRVAATFHLVCGYLLSVCVRITDTYKRWPANEISWAEWRPSRTLHGTIGFYTVVLLVLVSFGAIVLWLG